jgi:O-antigen ligase
VKKHGNIGAIMDAICVVSLFNLLVCLLQLLGADFISSDDGELGAIVGLFTNPNEAAALFAVSFFAFLRADNPTVSLGLRRLVLPARWFVLAPLPLIGLCLTRSFSAALALGAGAGVLVYARGHHKAVLGVVLCLLAYLAIDRPEVAGLRFSAWSAGAKIAIQSPWVGIGANHWKSTIPDSEGEFINARTDEKRGVVWWDTAHNDYVQLFYDQGFKGLIIILCFVGTLFFRAVRTVKATAQLLNAAFIACCVSSCFHWLMQNGTTSIIAVAYAAMLDKETA